MKLDDNYPDEATAKAELMRKYRIAVQRLADYEGTGLEPGEVVTMKNAFMGRELAAITELNGVPITRIRELAQAEKDGRVAMDPPSGPLALDELKQMDGEPVWVVIPENCVSEWCIAKFDVLMGRIRFWCVGGGWYDSKNCGESLFVFRRRPEKCVEP